MWAVANDFEVTAEAPTSHLEHYAHGALVRVRVSFTQDGISADPDGVNLRFRPPRQTLTTLIYGVDAAIVKDSIGVYHVDLDTTPAAGIWLPVGRRRRHGVSAIHRGLSIRRVLTASSPSSKSAPSRVARMLSHPRLVSARARRPGFAHFTGSAPRRSPKNRQV
jgi:hypothetical protein